MNRLVRACLVAALAGTLPACATTPPVAVEPPAVAKPSAVNEAQRARIERLAPDFLARADRATERARTRTSDDPDAAREHRARAELLLQAATLEADRIELARQLEAEHLRRDAALRALATERYRALARQTDARLARVASDPETGVGPPSAPNPSAAELTRRARLQLAAARVLGADASELAEAERQVRRVGARPAEARAALERAERVLASARSRTRTAGANPPSAEPP